MLISLRGLGLNCALRLVWFVGGWFAGTWYFDLLWVGII